ncbi:YiiX/YebB-like N1pC/P60 family cysteine hydrolase, partial [bacterium]|nr:YiiX/YebB-like N1pC/P60 family cysteine hydrolase [bacterium]
PEQLKTDAAGDDKLTALFELAGQLEQTLDVGLTTYAVARTRERARSIRTRVTQNLLGRSLYGLQKAVSGLMAEKYVVRGHKPGLPGPIFDDLAARIQPGDVFVVRKLHAITNYFLPGYWPHAALYVGTLDDMKQLGLHQHDNVREAWAKIESLDAKPHRALEALADGVHVRPLSRALASDAVAVLRPKLSSEHIAEALGRGFFHEGKPYDFDFDFTRSDRLVCTEVIYRTYEGVGDMQFELTRRAGRMTLAAEDMLRMSLAGNGFDTVALYSPEHSPEVLTGDEAATVLSETT